MGFLSRAVAEQKSNGTLELFKSLYGGRLSSSGRTVNVKTSLQVSAVVACVRVIGEGIAQVPLKLIRESKDGKTKLPAKDHPLYNVLAVKPNPWQTSFEFREMLAWHVVLTGNFFAFKNIVFGAIKELIPFDPARVKVLRASDGTLSYEVSATTAIGSAQGQDSTYGVTQESGGGGSMIFPAEAIWHVRGPSWNSWMGLDAVAMARDAIGLAMSTEQAHASLHRDGSQIAGAYSVEGTLSPEQHEKLQKWVEKNYGGADNAGKTMILDRSAKFQAIGMTGIDSEHLSTRRFQVEEIARYFRVNPIMLFTESKNTTYASAEQMFLSHVVHTMAPWWQRLEQSIDANLLTDKDRADGLFSNFVEEGLLRGAAKDTKDVLLGYTNGGIMTANEAREKLDLNPDPDPASDKLRIPANIVGTMPDANTPDKGATNGNTNA